MKAGCIEENFCRDFFKNFSTKTHRNSRYSNITPLYSLYCGIECRTVPGILIFVFFLVFPARLNECFLQQFDSLLLSNA